MRIVPLPSFITPNCPTNVNGFERVALTTVVWPNGYDMDPDVLIYDGPPPWVTGRELDDRDKGTT